MDLKHLRCLSVVVGTGSLSRAAATLGVSQPLLSRYVQELEREFGTQLLHRNGRGILPTDAGSLLVARADAIIRDAESLAAEMHTFAGNLKGRVVVSFPPSIGTVLTLPLLKHCRETYPDIAVQVVEGYGGHIIEWLSTGRSDIGILYNVPDKSTFTIDPLAHEDLMLVAASRRRCDFPERPVATASLAGLAMVLPSRNHGLRKFLDNALGRVGIALNIELEIDSLSATLDVVEEDLGFTILPMASFRRRNAAGTFVSWPIANPTLTREIQLLSAGQKPSTPAVRAVSGAAKSLIKALWKA